jgi:GrpB-like predicted nucleotidyltransferase (UPF0157 family)
MAYDEEIGLHRAIVKVVPYRPAWAEYFRKEKELLLKVVGDEALDIRHIGSTSIVGMPAKPIVDILVGLQTLSAVEPFVEDLNLIGYEDRGNGDELGRRYFVKGAEAKRTHHLNFCELNGSFWIGHVLFRDYLEKHADAAEQYAALKRALADRFPNNRKAYTGGKEEFVRSVLNLAMNERASLLGLSPLPFPEVILKR